MNARQSSRHFLRRRLVVAVALMATAALAPRPTTAQQPAASGVKVTVLLFSGRPDPTFQLTDAAQLAQMGAMLKEAPRQESGGRETILPAILGYKGIVVENPAALAELPRRFAVYGGAIEVGTERKQFFADPGNRLASFLLESAIERNLIPKSIVSRIREHGL